MDIRKIILLTGLGILSTGYVYAACPNMQGTYQSATNSTKFYLQKQDETHYRVVLDVTRFPLTPRNAQLASKKELQSQPYSALPDCTLNIENFGQLLPHEKGAAYYIHFDSQDFEKTFDTDYIVKIDDTPNGVMGMNKISNDIPAKALDVLNKQ